MKFLTVFFALCLMALPLEAQRGGGFHGGGGGGFHGGRGGFHRGGGFRGNPGLQGGFQNPPVGGFRGKPGISGGFHNAPVGGFHGIAFTAANSAGVNSTMDFMAMDHTW